jgi:cytoskeleton protein RodZ
MPVDLTSGDFGGRLREARERRGISLRQIANSTKISVAVLEALERNDVSRLPGGIFSRAFVRSYAIEVGLDPERTIQDFINRFPGDAITAGHPSAQPVEPVVPLDGRRWPSGFLSAATIAVVVAGAAVYSGAWRSWAADLAPLLRVREWHLPALTRSEAPGPAGAPETAANDPASAGEPVPSAVPAPLPPAARSEAADDVSDDRLTVRLSVSRPCFISATVDGRKTIERLLQIGEEQTIDVRRELVLTAADAGAVALTLNGRSARPLGAAGEVVTTRLSRANFRDFLFTR